MDIKKYLLPLLFVSIYSNINAQIEELEQDTVVVTKATNAENIQILKLKKILYSI